VSVILFTAAPLARADSETEQRLTFCKSCHRPGYSVSYVPTLDGQPREYLFNQLRAFKEKRRPSDGHQRYWGALSEEAMKGVADHFAANAPAHETFEVDAKKAAAGQSKAEMFRCASCHQLSYTGKDSVPRLAGLHPQYSSGQIRAFIAGTRRHPEIDANSTISPEDAEALSAYFAQLP
jgi:cytochrome c553